MAFRARAGFLALMLVVAIAISALASSNARRVVGNCTKSQIRPVSIVLTCADANTALTKLRWSSFGHASAYASGDYYENDCTPNCAAGKFHSYPVKLALTSAKVCRDKFDDYQRGTITFTGARPPGQKGAHASIQLFCPLPG